MINILSIKFIELLLIVVQLLFCCSYCIADLLRKFAFSIDSKPLKLTQSSLGIG